MTSLGLSDLVSPASLDAFFATKWDQAPFVGGPVAGAAGLVGLRDVEFLISSLAAPDPNWVQVVRSGAQVNPGLLATRDASPSVPAVLAAFAEGHTVQLAKLQKRHPPLAALCRDVERTFLRAGVPLARHAGSHLYLTPARSTGLAPHYDNHSVFAIQVAGTKLWRVREPVLPSPTGRQSGALSSDDLPEVVLEVKLAPGDVLYMPRGWVHEAEAGDETSIHVTVDLYPLTWLDLASRILSASPAFREALPVGSWSADGAGMLAEELGARLGDAIDDRSVAAAAQTTVEEFLEVVGPLAGDGLRSVERLADLTSRSMVRVRKDALPTVLTTSGAVKLCFAGSGFQGSIEAEKLLRFLAGADEFALHDLPGRLSEGSKLDLVRELVVSGVLDVV